MSENARLYVLTYGIYDDKEGGAFSGIYETEEEMKEAAEQLLSKWGDKIEMKLYQFIEKTK